MHRTKILLPGVSVLTRLISTVRDRALKIYGESSLVFQTMLRKTIRKTSSGRPKTKETYLERL